VHALVFHHDRMQRLRRKCCSIVNTSHTLNADNHSVICGDYPVTISCGSPEPTQYYPIFDSPEKG
jgi:hypothetical protein